MLGLGQSGAEACAKEEFRARLLGTQDRSPQGPRSPQQQGVRNPGQKAGQPGRRKKGRKLRQRSAPPPLELISVFCRPTRKAGKPAGLAGRKLAGRAKSQYLAGVEGRRMKGRTPYYLQKETDCSKSVSTCLMARPKFSELRNSSLVKCSSNPVDRESLANVLI